MSSFLSFTFVSLAGDPLANLRQNPKVSQLTLHLLVHKYHLDAKKRRGATKRLRRVDGNWRFAS